MAPPDSDWQRLADYVTRRRTQLGMTQGEVQAAGGPSVATMRLLEGAMQQGYRAVILGRLEEALRWRPGSVATILAGGEPTTVDRSETSRTPMDPDLLHYLALLADPDTPQADRDFMREQLRRWADAVERNKRESPGPVTRASGGRPG